jgi:hypothetical protein
MVGHFIGGHAGGGGDRAGHGEQVGGRVILQRGKAPSRTSVAKRVPSSIVN